MSMHHATSHAFNWRSQLPVLSGRIVTLREPVTGDCDALLALLSIPDAARFTPHDSPGPAEVEHLIARAADERAAGTAFTYVIVFAATGHLIGLMQVRQLDPLFEAAFWDCTLATEARGTGAFWEAAHLVASFAFLSAGASRLEARIDLSNGRGKAALRKIGAVQEGILRRSGRRGHEYVDQALWAVLKDTWEFDSLPPAVVVH
jgi:RimJ/RimL family protein N-acetyltransferase